MVVFVYGRKSKVMAKPFPSQHNHSTHFNSAKTCRMSQDIVKASESFQEFCTENSIWISFSLSLSLSLWDLSPKCWISIGFDTWPASPVPFRKQQTHLLGPIPWQIEKVKGVTPWCFLPNEINLVDHRPAGFWQKDPVVFKGMCEKDQANLKIYSKSTPKMPDFKGQ